ncbi:MAG: LacI family DNA-binding transcriptional regulator [Litoreibacter sp.]
MMKLPTKKRPTIADVAHLAGVSTATVSRALQSPDLVSEKNRKLIFDVVSQTGYRPNTAAKMLRQNRANTLLVVLPDIANPFFSEILSGIEDVATVHNYTILISNTNGDDARTRDLLGSLRNGRADGALLLNGQLPLPDHEIETLSLVSISEAIPNAQILHVGTDSIAATREATEYLITLGHKKIVHFGGPTGNILTKEREQGYRSAMQAAGLSDDITVIPSGFKLEDGQASVDALLTKHDPPDAIVCASDIAAMGAISGLTKRGYQVPQDISVIGFDDIDFSSIFSPPLTTIRQNRKELGKRATLMLLGLIEGTLENPNMNVVEHSLIERSSTILRGVIA